EAPTAEELRVLIRQLPSAAYARDLPGTIMPLLPAGFRALDVACENGDGEMFLIATAILSQPMLVAPETPWPSPERKSEWRQRLADGEQDPATLGEAYKTEHRELPTISLTQIATISITDVQASQAKNEVAVFLAANDSRDAYRMEVTAAKAER